jgi:hypothetical protein
MARKTPESVAARRSNPPAVAKPEPAKASPQQTAAKSPTVAPLTPAGTSVPTYDGAGGTRYGDDEVAVRAYQKWLARGCPIGDDKRDWFEAQDEVRREQESS